MTATAGVRKSEICFQQRSLTRTLSEESPDTDSNVAAVRAVDRKVLEIHRNLSNMRVGGSWSSRNDTSWFKDDGVNGGNGVKTDATSKSQIFTRDR